MTGMEKDAKIYVAGHRGLVGSAIVRRLEAGGWRNLVTRTRTELDLTDRPVLELRADGEPWKTSLTKRHAELLARLQLAGPAGLSAGQLSTALFGDSAHAVTIRAEISRLRRVIGALVDTNPYRLAEGVTLTVVGSG